jgi:hypothetical protein
MRVTEWLTRVDDDTVEYRFEIEDKDTWAEPWGGVYPLADLGGLLSMRNVPRKGNSQVSLI